ncbi:GNAT family N-acetyltransferase [Nocardia altamirensis]|uniref:GNAT family N-acetyltransferase n=1 Tax=Nocardia altamirensis TaxID=472158 RepID=UPI000A030CA3|nr:GNAT family N-acetyltransferase [Nocardia altamirensis]
MIQATKRFVSKVALAGRQPLHGSAAGLDEIVRTVDRQDRAGRDVLSAAEDGQASTSSDLGSTTGAAGVRPVVTKVLTGDDWQLRREFALRKLTDTPWAFKTTLEETQTRPPQYWRDQFVDRTSIIAVFRNGEPVGELSAVPSADRPFAQELIGVWVAPEARGSGVIDDLMRSQLQWLQDEGHRQVQVWTREDNVAMLRVAERHGFTVTGNTRIRSHTDIPSIELIRDLP